MPYHHTFRVDPAEHGLSAFRPFDMTIIIDDDGEIAGTNTPGWLPQPAAERIAGAERTALFDSWAHERAAGIARMREQARIDRFHGHRVLA